MSVPAWLQTTFALLLATSLASWCVTFAKMWKREPLVTAVDREPVPWNFLDVWVALATLFMVQSGVALVCVQMLGVPLETKFEDRLPADAAAQILAGGMGSVIAAILVFAFLHVARQARLSDLGIVAGRFLADLRLGLLAFLHLIAPVLLIQSALTHWWPSTHPIITLLKRSESFFPFAACIVSAVIIAPLVEEFLFRVVLQGWLEKWGVERGKQNAVDESATAKKLAFWPIVASAGIFSLAHLGHGPDMVALFVLAIGLGYLYRQTHRMLPGIVVHFLLNAWSMFALAALVRER